MAGELRHRLAPTRATEANLEPIYLVYEAEALVDVVRDVEQATELARGGNPDGSCHIAVDH